jgi:hypothetical protein
VVQQARAHLHTVGVDLGQIQQTFSRVSPISGRNITSKYSAKQYAFLCRRRQFAAQRGRLLAGLSEEERRGTLRPLSFSDVSGAVDARLAAPVRPALLARLARLERRSATMQKRALDAVLMHVKRGSVKHGTAVNGRLAVAFGKPTFVGKQFPIQRLIHRASAITRGPTFLVSEMNSTEVHAACLCRQRPVYRDARPDLRYDENGELTGNATLVARLRAHYAAVEAANDAGVAPPALPLRWGYVVVGGSKYCPTCRAFVSRDLNSAEVHRMFLDTYLEGRPRPAPFTPAGREMLGPKLAPFYLGRGEGLLPDYRADVFEMDPASRALAVGVMASMKGLIQGAGMLVE